MNNLFDPEQAVAEARREFGEHGGVSPSIERSSTFTVMEPGAMPEIFSGKRGPDRGGLLSLQPPLQPYNPPFPRPPVRPPAFSKAFTGKAIS